MRGSAQVTLYGPVLHYVNHKHVLTYICVFWREQKKRNSAVKDVFTTFSLSAVFQSYFRLVQLSLKQIFTLSFMSPSFSFRKAAHSDLRILERAGTPFGHQAVVMLPVY